MLGQQNQMLVPSLILLLTTVGWLYLAFGIVTTIWGLINLVRRKNSTAIYSQMVVSLVPSFIAVVAIYSTYHDFRLLAVSNEPPKPAAFAEVCTRGMAHGLWGILSTLVPVTVGLFTAWRRHRVAAALNPE